MPNSCGECSACCKLTGVHELRKPQNRWCAHAKPGTATPCSIYAERPESCRTYECGWLTWNLPEKFRPDKIKLIIESLSGHEMILLRVPPELFWSNWRREPVMHLIAKILESGAVAAYTDGKRAALFQASPSGIGWQMLEGVRSDSLSEDDIFDAKSGKSYVFEKVLHRGHFA